MSKTKIISFKLEEQAKADFEKLAKDNHTTPSALLYAFVHNKIKQSKSKLIFNKGVRK